MIKIQLKPNTNEVIIDYFVSSHQVNRKEAEELYATCEQAGMLHGTSAFDEAIEVVLDCLGLSSEILQKLVRGESLGFCMECNAEATVNCQHH